MAEMMRQLKDYVLAEPLAHGPEDGPMIRIHISHSNLKAKYPETRLEKYSTVGGAKDKIYQMTGTKPHEMILEVFNRMDQKIGTLTRDDMTLHQLGIQDGYKFHVIDLNPHSASSGGKLEDVSQVKKYVMSDEDYDKREDTYRKHKEKMKQLDPEWTAQKHLRQARRNNEEKKILAVMNPKIGDRCECVGGRRGTIRYIGEVPEIARDALWIGVELDEPMGQNNGSADGKVYFECKDQFGSFLRPSNVQVGDFPSLDDELGLDGSEDEL